MTQCRGCCVLLIATLLTAIFSVISESVCEGETITLFKNLTCGCEKTIFFLYKTGPSRTRLIAIWSHPKSDKNKDPQHLAPYRNRLVFDDTGGNISLTNFGKPDEATYVIHYGVSGTNMTQKVEIVALVAPEENCRPKIQPNKDNTTLSASVETSVCGRPPLSIQWQDSPGISFITSTVIKLPLGKEAGTYSACMVGPALACVKNATKQDYCSNYIIEEKHPPLALSDSLDQTKLWHVLLAVMLTMIVAAIIIVILCWKIKRGLKEKHHWRSCALQNKALLHDSQPRLQGHLKEGE